MSFTIKNRINAVGGLVIGRTSITAFANGTASGTGLNYITDVYWNGTASAFGGSPGYTQLYIPLPAGANSYGIITYNGGGGGLFGPIYWSPPPSYAVTVTGTNVPGIPAAIGTSATMSFSAMSGLTDVIYTYSITKNSSPGNYEDQRLVIQSELGETLYTSIVSTNLATVTGDITLHNRGATYAVFVRAEWGGQYSPIPGTQASFTTPVS